MVQHPDQLASVLSRLEVAPRVAVDTEADSLHAYPEKICLIQLALPGEELLVDPLCGLDLAPLWHLLADKPLIFHGADYDLRMLYRTYSFTPRRVYDTMLAARLLGLPEFGLDSLLATYFNVRLDKNVQKANWSLRPLTDRMAAYALNDVRHLHALADRLSSQLADHGRLSWHQQLCDQLIRDCTQPPNPARDDQWRLKGSARLEPRALAVLRELWSWRETEAVAANRPPYFILSHESLIQIAIQAAHGNLHPQTIPPRFSSRRRQLLLEAIARGLSLPDSQLPKQRSSPARRLSPHQKLRLEELRAHRDRQAARLNLDPALIASRATLVQLAASWEQTATTLLLPWQRELLDTSTPPSLSPRPH